MKIKNLFQTKFFTALSVLVLILAAPIVLVGCLAGLPYFLYTGHREKKKYLSSPYYQRFRVPYRPWISNGEDCRFYNEAVSLGKTPQMLRQSSNGLAYVCVGRKRFLFPDREMDGVYYSDRHGEWRIQSDGDDGPLAKAWQEWVGSVEEDVSGLELYLLLRELDIFPRNAEDACDDYALALLPPYVKLVDDPFEILDMQ